jgi:ribosomal protein S12 methylthiotransferase
LGTGAAEDGAVTGDGDAVLVGRAAHQAPETDGQVLLRGGPAPLRGTAIGRMVEAKVVATEGVDLVAEPLHSGPEGGDEDGPGNKEAAG